MTDYSIWIRKNSGKYVCEKCERMVIKDTPYCPYCGRKMYIYMEMARDDEGESE